MNKYVIITSAYNEKSCIENTIKSVLAQTLKPVHWYIISDCSTDGTDEIVKQYAENYDFIRFYRRDDSEKASHCFASKASALNSLLTHIDLDTYEYLAVLDADILLPENYYEELLRIFSNDNNLGIIGGSVYEKINDTYVLHDVSLNIVCGAVQCMRMDCFKKVSPIELMPNGGEDSMMCIKANYHGWQTKTFLELKTYEQKFVGRAQGSKQKYRLQRGKHFFDLGYHPLFMFVKTIYRILEPPFFIGSFFEMYGYIYQKMTKKTPFPSKKYVRFLRQSQMQRLLKFQTFR